MRLLVLMALCFCQSVFAAVQIQPNEPLIKQSNQAFVEHYRQQLGTTQSCATAYKQRTQVCSAALRNEGNGPYILHHGQVTDWVVVLFHGLSDSPFYLRSVADGLHDMGVTVVVGLLPGHGLQDADQDMQDPDLADRWVSGVQQVVEISRPMGRKLMVGGFSTGATLATHFALMNSDIVDGLLLFSGAFLLSDNAERMTRIWGMQTIAKWIDGDYRIDNPNPYKYPKVALYAVWELMEIIRQVRSITANQAITIPIFAAHSMSDVTTPFAGVEILLEGSSAAHSLFLIDESYALCHGDLPLNENQVQQIAYQVPVDELIELCSVPDANPLHSRMMDTLINFIKQQ